MKHNFLQIYINVNVENQTKAKKGVGENMGDYFSEERFIVTHLGDNNEYAGAVVPPVFLNSLHVFPSIDEYYATDPLDRQKYVYGRSGNPTVRLVEQKVAALEHGEAALCFASGMAAASGAVMACCKSGGHVICVRNAYGPLKQFLTVYCAQHLNLETTFVEGSRIEEFEQNIRPNTQLIILESPSSIVFSLQDIRAVTALAKANGIRTYIDNTFCSPLFQKPLDMGVDLVMHTMSKYLGGHSDIIGGVLVAKDGAFLNEIASQIREWFGGIFGPMEAWLVLRGMRTLEVRLLEHERNAMQVATFLEQQKGVHRVLYPGLKSHPQYELMQRQQKGNSGLLSFELETAPEKVAACLKAENLETFKIGVSWGGFESLITMPFYHLTQEEAEALGTTRGIIRIHCGLEGAEGQIKDLERLLACIGV